MFELLYYVCFVLLVCASILLFGQSFLTNEKDWDSKAVRSIKRLILVTIALAWLVVLMYKGYRKHEDNKFHNKTQVK